MGLQAGSARRDRLARARLYLVVESRPPAGALGPLLERALAGGVDAVQLRDKDASDDELLAAAEEFRARCDDVGALFVLNDRPELVAASRADGVHLGQQDMAIAQARRLLGPDLLIGLSTHSPEHFDAALRSGADYLSAGPVHSTPTKPGRPATGFALIRHAAAEAAAGIPWFAIGGINPGNVDEVVSAGARRVAVVRAVRDAPDPFATARELRAAIEREEATVGAS
jgi:thiamine-phosphate pyrophosphorylase